MRIMVFTEGTIIMHKNAVGHNREEIVRQVEKEPESVHDYDSYIPVGNAVKKLKLWKNQGAEILYLTSRRKTDEIRQIKNVLKKHGFPDGQLLSRQKDEVTITHVRPKIKAKIKSIIVKEFGGIDNLTDKISDLLKFR